MSARSAAPAATVVKIGGSTLGAQDTSLQDVVALHRAGARPVVVHGGGAMISDWLKRLEIESHFVDGLRSTSPAAMEVVLGVLRGVVKPLGVAGVKIVGDFVGNYQRGHVIGANGFQHPGMATNGRADGVDNNGLRHHGKFPCGAPRRRARAALWLKALASFLPAQPTRAGSRRILPAFP